MVIDHNRRLRLLKDDIRTRRLDSFLVTGAANVSYLSGFRGHDALILVTAEVDFFITDSRYIEEAKASIRGFSIKLVNKTTFKTVKDIIKRQGLKRVGFESMDLSYAVASRLKGLISPSRLVPVKDMVEELRSVKDEVEIDLIKNSIVLTKKTFKKVTEIIRPGLAESFIAKQAEIEFIEKGARPSFDPIVACDTNSSKPHASPSNSRITKSSFIMIDIGCNLNGYCSDMTRMVIMGKVKEKFKKIYGIVRAAQELAIGMIKPGARIAEVDLAARRYIHKNGFGKYFGHALGHGVGMEVHEHPSISRLNEALIKPGMVFTVEPAIYIPKFGGVRIEDMVLVKRNGCEILTS